MPQGFQVFNGSGGVVLDTTMRTGRILGSVVITGNNGSVNVPSVIGTPFVIIPKWPRPSNSGQFGEAFVAGNVTFDGTTIRWSFGLGGAIADLTTVYYGAY